MMRFVFCFLMIALSIPNLFSQRIGDRPNVSSQSDKDATIMSVDINKDETLVTILVNKNKKDPFSFSSGTTLTTKAGIRVSLKKFTDGRGWLEFDKKYRPTNKNYTLYLYFGKIGSGTESIDIEENCDGGKFWKGISLKLPTHTQKNTNTYSRKNTFSESQIKQQIIGNNDGITGIYEAIGNNGYKLACTKEGENYKLTYISAKTNYYSAWQPGDTKAILRPSATYGVFKATWYMANKSANNDALIMFDGVSMKTYIAGEEDYYLKMYPTASQNGNESTFTAPSQWSGTGFALNDGYIATNFHVVDGAKSISVLGVKGVYNIEFGADVIATDKVNDLAIIKINDSRFSGFGTIPYRVKTSTSEVGEDIFVLGYPLTTTMGDEIKLTTGVISSKTGFQGDVSLYQISAPIQPGNSGGPLFDGNGNLIGIVNAKHQGAENVGYAIKTSYLRNLMESVTSQNLLPTNNSISGQALTGKVRSVKNFVFMIKCSNRSTPNSSYSSTRGNEGTSWEYQTTRENVTCKITRVVVDTNETKVYFALTNKFSFRNWYNIDRDTYIQVNNGNKLKLARIENISYAPEKKYFEPGETVYFMLSFAALPKGTTKFDLIESDSSSWRFYNVKVK